MKKLIWLIATVVVVSCFYACNKDEDVDLNEYNYWKQQNESWIKEMENLKTPEGEPYYTKLIPTWNKGAYILIRYFNDRAETAGNLVPLYTSTVDVRYIGYNCEGEPFDSSTVDNSYGKLGVRRFAVNELIQGWSIALMDMHVGDTAEIVIPYDIAYGTTYTGTILPYSALRFNVRLEDIYLYEASQK